MAYSSNPSPGAITRKRFMLGVLGGAGAAIGLVYIGVILRYLYPASGNATPPLDVQLGADGVTPPGGPTLLWRFGVAGPFYYPLTPDMSVVVGMFVEQKVPNGDLSAANLRAVEQTCTHLGCPVNWVPGDNRFECPCHGSQFNRNLSVYHGPAARPLWQHEFTLAGAVMTIRQRL